MLAHLRVQELDKSILKESLGKQNPAWFHSCDICESVEQTHQPLAGEISWQTWGAHWKQGEDPEAQSGSNKEQCSYGGRSLWFTSFPLWHQVWEELSLLSKFPGNYILKEIEHNVQVLKYLTRHFPFCLSRYLLFFWHCSDEHVMPLKYSDEQESWLQNIPGVRVSFLSHWFDAQKHMAGYRSGLKRCKWQCDALARTGITEKRKAKADIYFNYSICIDNINHCWKSSLFQVVHALIPLVLDVKTHGWIWNQPGPS